jgi:hypothetical protein
MSAQGRRGMFKSICCVFGTICTLGAVSVPLSTGQPFAADKAGQWNVTQRGDAVAKESRVGRPVRWEVLDQPTARQVRIGMTVGWCPGSHRPKPRIQRVRQVYHQNVLILTAFLIHPTPKGRPGRPGCLGVELPLEYTVTFARDRDGRPLFDGSTGPPARRWPKR